MQTINKREIDQLLIKLETNESTRRTEKTFTISAVLTILGLAFARLQVVEVWFFLLPYVITVPYSAHITYYRIIHARVNAYLIEFAPEYRTLNIVGQTVAEGEGVLFRIIEILNNYELYLLSVVSSSLFYLCYPMSIFEYMLRDWLICSVPLILSLLVFAITWYGTRYIYWSKKFCAEWRKIKINDE